MYKHVNYAILPNTPHYKKTSPTRIYSAMLGVLTTNT